MTRYSHLTNSEYRAVQCQRLAAEYAARAMKMRDTRWFLDAADAERWAAEYSAAARRLLGVEV